jgi:hypothetical protein
MALHVCMRLFFCFFVCSLYPQSSLPLVGFNLDMPIVPHANDDGKECTAQRSSLPWHLNRVILT